MKMAREGCVIISRYNPRVGVPLLIRLKKVLEFCGPCRVITAQDPFITDHPAELDPTIATALRVRALTNRRFFDAATMHLNETVFFLFVIFQLIKIGPKKVCWIVFDETSYLACLFLRIPQKKIIYYAIEQPLIIEGGSRSPLFWLRNALYKKYLYRVGLLVAVNGRRLTLIVRTLSLKNIQRMVIRNVTDKCSTLRSRLPSAKPIIFYQGRISPHTCEDIIFKMIEEYNQHFEFIIAGFVAENSPAQKKLEHLVARGVVKYVGYLPAEMLEVHRKNASLSIVFWDANAGFSSLKYCEPNKLYELMASGIPVICTPNPTIRDIVESYDIGWCLEGYAGEGLDMIMNEIIHSPKLLELKSQNCFVAFKEKYNYESEIKPLINYIKKMPSCVLQ